MWKIKVLRIERKGGLYESKKKNYIILSTYTLMGTLTSIY